MRTYDLDPHTFLGRVACGEQMILAASNESGCLWREHWEMRDGKYGFWLWGPCGSAWEPMDYEQAYKRAATTMRRLRRMKADGSVL